MSARTAGPWKTIPSPHGRKYRCVQFGASDMYTSLEMLPADARLVAAAPELLDALKLIVDTYGFDSSTDSAIWKTAHAAITKATGEKY